MGKDNHPSPGAGVKQNDSFSQLWRMTKPKLDWLPPVVPREREELPKQGVIITVTPFISWVGVSPGQLNSQIVFFEPLQGRTSKIWPLGVGVIAAPVQFWANRKATGKDFISSTCDLSCRRISHFKTPSTGLIFQMKGRGIPWNCPWLPWRL